MELEIRQAVSLDEYCSEQEDITTLNEIAKKEVYINGERCPPMLEDIILKGLQDLVVSKVAKIIGESTLEFSGEISSPEDDLRNLGVEYK